MKLVIVKWVDSSMIGGWFGREDEFLGVSCESVGWVLNETDKEIIIVQSITDVQVGNVLTVPKICVENIDVLREDAENV